MKEQNPNKSRFFCVGIATGRLPIPLCLLFFVNIASKFLQHLVLQKHVAITVFGVSRLVLHQPGSQDQNILMTFIEITAL